MHVFYVCVFYACYVPMWFPISAYAPPPEPPLFNSMCLLQNIQSLSQFRHFQFNMSAEKCNPRLLKSTSPLQFNVSAENIENTKKSKKKHWKNQKKKNKKNNILRLLPYLLHSQDLLKIVFFCFFCFFLFFRCFLNQKKTKKNNILRLLPYLLHSQDLWKIVFLLFFWFFWFFRCFFGFLLYPFLTILQSSYRLIRFSSEKDWTNIYIRDFLRLQAFHFLWASPPCLLWPVPALWQSHRNIMKSYSAICRLVANDIPKKTKCTCYTSVLHSIFFQV